MKLLGLLALLSLSAFAQDYERVQFENENFRDFTREELTAKLGENASVLEHYHCNGKDEFDTFWPAVRQNEKGDSLRIKLYESEETLTYWQGAFFKENGDRAKDLSNIFVKYAKDALAKIEKIPEGALLLRQLERSIYPITITYGLNSFFPSEEHVSNYKGVYMATALSIFSRNRMTGQDVPFYNIGAGGKLSWNPKTEGMPSHIALAHEMYHAFDSIRGILDMRMVSGEKYEFVLASEYRAVYFENLARKAAKIPLRSHYGKDQEGPGVLDDAGEPIKIPSPCL